MRAMFDPRGARSPLLLAAACFLLGACAVVPVGPSVLALPGSSKTVEEYQSDVSQCQQYSNAVIAAAGGGNVAAANNSAASTAATGTVLGAATGAIIGAATGQAGQGAAIGAGLGLLFGGAAGSSYTSMSSYQLQRGYDSAYLNCMYSHGNRVPVARGYEGGPSRPTYARPNVGYPPPNTPPPPGVESGGHAPPSYVPPSSYPPPDQPPPPGIGRT